MYPDKAKEMKRTLLEYLNTLRRAHIISPKQNSADGAESGLGYLKIDPNGFPVALKINSWNKVMRAKLEPLYRLYIAQHYRK